MDDASSVFDASILTGPVANYPVADSYNRTLERDYSTGDIPHIFVASAVWDIPVGANRRTHMTGVLGAIVNDWSLTGILTLQSGVPLAVTQTTNNNAFAGFGTQRPEPDRGSRRCRPTSGRRADGSTPARFPRPRCSRSARARAIRCGDLATATSIWRSCATYRSRARTLELRAEAFNLTNTPFFSAPNTTQGSAAFGTITAAGDPRVIQLAMKFIF